MDLPIPLAGQVEVGDCSICHRAVEAWSVILNVRGSEMGDHTGLAVVVDFEVLGLFAAVPKVAQVVL